MFTGLIEEVGTLTDRRGESDSAIVTVAARRVLDGVSRGDSISVDGVCLTVTDFSDRTFSADVMRTTLDHSTLGQLPIGSAINLERAVRVDSRLGGHIVTGHVDAVATVEEVNSHDHYRIVRCAVPEHLGGHLAPQGSIAINGVSLTISNSSAIGDESQWCEVSLIPETLASTNLANLVAGAGVNVETDVFAKYIARMGRTT